ncbi:zinc ribbon domain-containing protein [Bacillus cereus]|uniref:zinc ribbon domain-containing protein n=1 Tax=Bacillus cereus TaxID=1396 RepID=UPI000B4AB609|nr:zinc ribbon domain-containing protein [Bacillus cereus]
MPNNKQTTFLELRLYDNGIDFINKSMESFVRATDTPSPVEYKYAILLLATGSELILKSILEDIHPLFIKENLDASTEKTVKAENLVSRINKVYEYADTKKRIQSLDADNLNAIREIRNNIIHKEIKFNDEKIPQKVYSNTLFSLDRIVKEFKSLTLSSVVNNWSHIVGISHIQDAYYKSVKGITLNGISVPCPFCSIKKLVKKNKKIECLHCGNNFDSLTDAINSLDDDALIKTLYKAFVIEKQEKGMRFMECPKCDQSDHIWYEVDEKSINCFQCGPLPPSRCPKCTQEAVVTYYYDFKGYPEQIDYCFECDEDVNVDTCPNCYESLFALREKIKIDVKDSKRFYRNVNFKSEKSPFIEIALCPKCYDYMQELQSKSIIDIF